MADPVTKPEMNEALGVLGREFRSEMETLRNEMLERIERSETTLLKEFRKWAIRIESPLRANQVLVGGFNERLSVVEERVEELERGRR